MVTRTALFAVVFALLALAAPREAAFAQQTDTLAQEADTLAGAGTLAADSLFATLTGPAEVPSPGDADGEGMAALELNAEAGEVCFEITVSNIGEPTAAHVHRGAAGESGPPVVNFNVPVNGLTGCVSEVADGLIEEIQTNPAGFYVNVHNEEHPAGAVRGQLGTSPIAE